MWSSIVFILIVVVGSFFAWRWCKRRCILDDSDEHEANAVALPPARPITPAPRVPRSGLGQRPLYAYEPPQEAPTSDDSTSTALNTLLIYELLQSETKPTHDSFSGDGGTFGGGGASGSWDSGSSSSDSGSDSSSSSSGSDY